MKDQLVVRLRHRRAALQRRRLPASRINNETETPVLNAANPVTSDGMDLSAQTVPGADGYQFRITESGGSPDVTPVLGTPVYTGEFVRDLFSATDYDIEVRAINSAAPVPESAWSAVITETTQATTGSATPETGP